jgi:hypothetical protein
MQIVAKMKVLMSPPRSHSKRAASDDCPCATSASAARQRTGTSFLADASFRGDGRLSDIKRSGGSSARRPALQTH